MIALAAKLCHTPLTISFAPNDDERSRTCGADIPMEMYEDAAHRNKYIATAKPVKSGQVRPHHSSFSTGNGKETVNSLYFPSTLSTLTYPPCSRATFIT